MNDTFYELNLEYAPLAFLDVETTGLEPERGHRVCEIAVVRTEGRLETRRLSTLINPDRAIGAGAQAVNGITDSMVADAPRFTELIDDLQSILDGVAIVAHNAPFDLGFVNHELRLAMQAVIRNPVVDTLAIARRAYSFPSNSLDALTSRLGLAHPQQHRALGDALAVRSLLWWLIEDLRRKEVRTLGDLMGVQRGASHATPIDEPIPPELADAITHGRSVHLRYRSSHGTVSERWVDPIRIDERTGLRYLVAYCHVRQAERSFRLDRILAVHTSQSSGMTA